MTRFHFHPLRRRLVASGLLALVPALSLAGPLTGEARAAMLAFDRTYIAALFLTGAGGRSAQAAASATAAMQALHDQWPARKSALAAAVPGQPIWTATLDAVEARLRDALALVSSAQWAHSHEALEAVRDILFQARRSLGLDYALDRFTAYHAVMEKLAGASPSARRATIEMDFASARVLWAWIEATNFDATVYGLTPDRARQLAQAVADESAALSRLSQALRTAGDEELHQAAAALKPPFVRAYLSFGAAP